MLMSNSVTTVDGQRHESSSALDDHDLVITIETSPAPLLPILEEQDSDASETLPEEGAIVSIKSKRHTKQAAATQSIELEVS